MMKFSTSIFIVAALLKVVYAWGADGHHTIGFVAMQFLTPRTLSFVQTFLGPEFNESLGTAATWADEIRSDPSFSWSSPLHFVDAEDDPEGGSCSVHEMRDCGDGACVLTAIANYTVRIVDTSLDMEQRSEALRFLDHFIGDITQPLHVEAIAAGGNGIRVTCSGRSTNLHSVWDTSMLDIHLNNTFRGSIATYTNNLVARIRADNFSVPVQDFISCVSTTDPFTDVDPPQPDTDPAGGVRRDVRNLLEKRDITPLACPLVWARESNGFDCSNVFSFTNGTDICTGTYLEKAIPVIDLQLARAGLRIATWLNELLDPDY